jgi:predicted metal-dependent phosphoesterase TrpH
MKIDLHIHSKSSDGKFSAADILKEAKTREIDFLSITDHDSISCQPEAEALAKEEGIRYVCGVELNICFSRPQYREGKAVALDFLGYQFDPNNKTLKHKLETVAKYRQERAAKILGNLNAELEKQGLPTFTEHDFWEIEASVDGTLGRPHIADHLVKRGIVKTRQEAFDKYLIRCDVPKYPVRLEEASKLIRDAGGKLVLAHPNDPRGTSLSALTKSLSEQTRIIQESMMECIDGVECWHSRNDAATTNHYVNFAKQKGLMMTGGSDCHQKPLIMGSVQVPDCVADQFKL